MVNTLLSYFPRKSPQATTPKVQTPVSEKKKDDCNSYSNTFVNQQQIDQDKDRAAGWQSFHLYQVVWGKLEGYPWWPSLICNDPDTLGYIKDDNKPPLKRSYHVQFFDNPPSRAWLIASDIQVFSADDKIDIDKGRGQFACRDPGVKKAAGEAYQVLQTPADQRNKFLASWSDEARDGASDTECLMALDSIEQQVDNSDIEDNYPNAMATQKRRLRKPAVKSARKKLRMHDDSDSDAYVPSQDDCDSDSVSSGDEESEICTPDDEADSDAGEIKVVRSKTKAKPTSKSQVKNCGKILKSENFEYQTPSNKQRSCEKAPVSADSVTSKKESTISPTRSSTGIDLGNETYQHHRLKWLKDGFRKDSKCRFQSDPNYDSRTLWVPPEYLKNQTPLQRQWWQIKSENFDSVLCFKVGKFYEMYHMDAMIGIAELGLILMKGGAQSSCDVAHCGFPEIAFIRHAEALAQKGYRVVRVEQTETPQMMEERVRRLAYPTKFDKVVNREICGRLSKGTRTFSVQNCDSNEESAFLLAIIERECGDVVVGGSTYGVCFVDTTIGNFHIGQFVDDRQCSRLRTMIAHFPPVQILHERGRISSKIQHIFQHDLLSALKDALISGSEFMDSANTLKTLSEKNYFKEDENDVSDASLDLWPETLKKFVEGSGFGILAKESHDLAISALGACIWYLTKCFMDFDLLSLKNFEEYIPSDSFVQKGTTETVLNSQHMILDATTLTNLDIMPNLNDATSRGTLLGRLDICVTPFGRRLFKHWLCTPLCNPTLINDRLDAIEDIFTISLIVADCSNALKKLPDLEKLIRKIHSFGLSRKSNHPDIKAIFFEDTIYSKRKIIEFISVINGFDTATQIVELLQENRSKMKSRLLIQIVTYNGENYNGIDGKFPMLRKHLKFFEKAFDHEQAKKEGKIVPKPGADSDYDDAIETITMIKAELDDYLELQRKRLGCRKIRYWGQGRNRYQLEVPESILSRIPDDYELKSRKKGFKRFWTSDIVNLYERLTSAEERRDAALKDAMRRLFHKFDENHKEWDMAVQILAMLDALSCLAAYSSSIEGDSCRPNVTVSNVDGDGQPYIEIRNGRHPCVVQTFSGGDFIPNDTIIRSGDAESANSGNCVLVTGPNMGGKSTLMRQVGLIVVMAQLGCYIPASSCSLTPVDRLFTRLGASDRIMSGESTFFVELSETSTILRHATKHSLVLLDELGRGTATYDGTAIASAVVNYLSKEIRCRTLFSTHYHSLVEDFVSCANVRLGHMACMVENENDDDPCKETIVFLYKFVGGASPKSYGFNAARLAGLPDDVTRNAKRKAIEFEESAKKLHLFRSIYGVDSTSCNVVDLVQLCKKLQIH